MSPKSNFTLGAFVFFGGYQTQILLRGLLPISGVYQTQHPPFLWAKNQISLWGYLSFCGGSKKSNSPKFLTHVNTKMPQWTLKMGKNPGSEI
jgi:hypothetical protein